MSRDEHLRTAEPAWVRGKGGAGDGLIDWVREAAETAAHETLGALFAAYIWLVRRTNRFTIEPADLDDRITGNTPVIVAMWHGQHLMISFAWPSSIERMGALISRHVDAGAQAVALRWLGVIPMRGSGGRPTARARRAARRRRSR